MQIVNSSASIGPVSGSGPQVTSVAVDMGATVTKAVAFLTGFTAEFSGGNDHHLGLLDVQVQVPGGGVSGSTVNVQVTYGLRDWSGDWDDQYDGQIFFTVIGE